MKETPDLVKSLTIKTSLSFYCLFYTPSLFRTQLLPHRFYAIYKGLKLKLLLET